MNAKQLVQRAQRVAAKGAALLDKVRPGWWRKVKLAELDMPDCSKCILGQVYGDFLVALHKLRPKRNDWDRFIANNGFDITIVKANGVEPLEISDDLGAAWSAEIRKRRRDTRRLKMERTV